MSPVAPVATAVTRPYASIVILSILVPSDVLPYVAAPAPAVASAKLTVPLVPPPVKPVLAVTPVMSPTLVVQPTSLLKSLSVISEISFLLLVPLSITCPVGVRQVQTYRTTPVIQPLL